MSDPVDFEKYVRVNRLELVSDTNLSAGGSLESTVTNPVQTDNGAYLLSRVGGLDTGDGRKPVSGYCVKFDVNNQNVFIQTNISSTNALDNWNITIKGEGTVDVLYVDTTGDYIAIKQKQALTGSDYFNLSYIAFVSRTSGKIEHLFECEENSGLYLYDAITGDTAFFTTDGTTAGVSSLTDLRSSATSKEWIRDEGRNLDNKLSFPTFIEANQTNVTNSTIPVIPNFDGMTIKIPFTIVFTGKFLSSDSITFGRYGLGYAGYSGINTYKGITAQNFTVRDVPSGNSVNNYVSFNKIYDGIEHKFIWVVGSNPNNTSKMMFFVDGEDCIIPNSGNGDISLLSSVTFGGGSSGTNKFFIAGKNRYIKDFKIFNFDISANDAPYTIQDYQNGKDVPSELKGAVTYISNDTITPYSINSNTWEASIDNNQIKNTKKTDTTASWNSIKMSPISIKKGDILDITISPIKAYFASESFETAHDYKSDVIEYQINNSERFSGSGDPIGIKIKTGGSARYIATKDYPNFAITGISTYASSYENNPSGDTFLTGDYTIFSFSIKVNGTLLNLNNISSTNWLDTSLNNNSATLSGTFDLPNKEYGTWCNAVGYNIDNGVNIPRKVLV